MIEHAMTEPTANPPLNYDAVAELIPAYTLGILEPDEMLAVDDYLRRHQDLLVQMERMDDTVAHLALATPSVTPAPAVKTKLMARVHSALSQEPTIDLKTVTPVEKAAPAPKPAPAKQEMTWLDQLRFELGGGLMWPTSTALAVVACLLLAVLSIQMWNNQRLASLRLSAAQESVQALSAQNAQLQSTNQELNQQLRQRDNQIARFSEAMSSIALEGTEFAPQANGAFYAGRSSGVLILSGLAALPGDQTYQLWLIPADGDPVSVGLVQVNGDGTTTSEIILDGQPQDFAAVGLSIEPAGGSPQPTGPIVLLGTVSS